jgi:hypothetical protein
MMSRNRFAHFESFQTAQTFSVKLTKSFEMTEKFPATISLDNYQIRMKTKNPDST